jgi:hypothetical protein
VGIGITRQRGALDGVAAELRRIVGELVNAVDQKEGCGSRRDQRKSVTLTDLNSPVSVKLAGFCILKTRETRCLAANARERGSSAPNVKTRSARRQ